MTAQSRARLSVLAMPFPVSGIGGPFATCCGIDVTTCAGAPGDELLRIDVSAMDGKAARLSAGFRLLGKLLPSVIRSGERVLICHDFENTGIILASIPRDAHDLDRIGHTDSLHAVSDASHGSGLRGAGNGAPKDIADETAGAA
jgi:hypothetical protein